MKIILLIIVIGFVLTGFALLRYSTNWKANGIFYMVECVIMAFVLIGSIITVRNKTDMMMVAIDAFLVFISLMNSISYLTKKQRWQPFK